MDYTCQLGEEKILASEKETQHTMSKRALDQTQQGN
jgi:hypothetical protein